MRQLSRRWKRVSDGRPVSTTPAAPRAAWPVVTFTSDVSFHLNGDEMRARLAEEPADLILLDLILPDEDGLSLARDLRAESDVAIIMLTGKTDTIDKIVGLELGADDYITKPFDLDEVFEDTRPSLSFNANLGSTLYGLFPINLGVIRQTG